jgi:hypothetical protein
MKKLIAILVVFAVMTTALFAQEGSWSVGGGAEFGTYLNLLPYELRDPDNYKSEQTVVTAGGGSYNQIDWWGNYAGRLSVNYNRGGLSAGFDIQQLNKLGVSAQFNGENFAVKYGSNLTDLFDGNFSPNSLWGWYEFLDGMIHLEAAVKSQDLNPWHASGLIGDSYSKFDGKNILYLDVKPFQGLSFGFVMPGLFVMSGNGDNDSKTQQGGPTSTIHDTNSGADFDNVNGTGYSGRMEYSKYSRLVEDSLENSTFGVKFASGPITVAAQYGLRGRTKDAVTGEDIAFLNSVAYAGVQFDVTSAIRAELALHAKFFKTADDVNRTDLQAGGRFRFSSGPLMARVDLIYFNDVNGTGSAGGKRIENGMFRIRPYVDYKIIDNRLMFRLDTRVDLPLSNYFLDGYDLYSSADKTFNDQNDNSLGIRSYTLGYRIIPELFFNFLGNGIGDYWGFNTGMIVRYRVQGTIYGAEGMPANDPVRGDYYVRHKNDPSLNALEIVFRWSF